MEQQGLVGEVEGREHGVLLECDGCLLIIRFTVHVYTLIIKETNFMLPPELFPPTLL